MGHLHLCPGNGMIVHERGDDTNYLVENSHTYRCLVYGCEDGHLRFCAMHVGNAREAWSMRSVWKRIKDRFSRY